jgi:hypothetical protein
VSLIRPKDFVPCSVRSSCAKIPIMESPINLSTNPPGEVRLGKRRGYRISLKGATQKPSRNLKKPSSQKYTWPLTWSQSCEYRKIISLRACTRYLPILVGPFLAGQLSANKLVVVKHSVPDIPKEQSN